MPRNAQQLYSLCVAPLSLSRNRFTGPVARILANAATALCAIVAATSPWSPGSAPVISLDEVLPGSCGELTAAGVRRQLLLQLTDPRLTGAVAGVIEALHRAAGGWEGERGPTGNPASLSSLWALRTELHIFLVMTNQYLNSTCSAVYYEVLQQGGWVRLEGDPVEVLPDPDQPPQQQQQQPHPRVPEAGQPVASSSSSSTVAAPGHVCAPDVMQLDTGRNPAQGQLLLPPLVERLVHALEAGGLLDTLCRLLLTAPLHAGLLNSSSTAGSTSGSSASSTAAANVPPEPGLYLNLLLRAGVDATLQQHYDAETRVQSSCVDWGKAHFVTARCLAASLHGLVELLAPALPPGLPLPQPAPGLSGAPRAPPAPALRGLLLLLSPAVQRVQVCLLRRFLALHGDEGEDAEEEDAPSDWDWDWDVGPGGGSRAEGIPVGKGGSAQGSPRARQRQVSERRAARSGVEEAGSGAGGRATQDTAGTTAAAAAAAAPRQVGTSGGCGWLLLDAQVDCPGFKAPPEFELLLGPALRTWAAACRLLELGAMAASGTGGGTVSVAAPSLAVVLRRLRRVLLAVRRAARHFDPTSRATYMARLGLVCSCEVAYYGVWGAAGRLGVPGGGEELAAYLPRALEVVGIAADVCSWLVAERGRQARELEREQQQEQQQGPGGAGEAGGGGSGTGGALGCPPGALPQLKWDCEMGLYLLAHVSTCAVALGLGWVPGVAGSGAGKDARLGGCRGSRMIRLRRSVASVIMYGKKGKPNDLTPTVQAALSVSSVDECVALRCRSVKLPS